MCGIIGYIGPKPVVPIILDGLRRLEYRGYDSAGIAVVDDGAHSDPAQRRQADQPRTGHRARADVGHYGLGHTRWATHGRPTKRTPTRIATAPAASSWSTTASSRTTSRSRKSCSPKDTSSNPRPTPRWWRTWCRRNGRATVSKTPCCAPWRGFAACSRWCCCRPTIRRSSSRSATARRSSSASATVSTSSPPTCRRS